MSSSKLPAFQFYPADWRKDIAIQSLDYDHRGVWLELLCMMHESPERGRLVLPSGEALPDDAIARNLGLPEAEWKQKRSKLLAYGVASEDGSGVLYNRRMVRDEDIRQKRADAGRKGGQVSKPRSKPRSKREAEGGSSSSSSTSVNPSLPDGRSPLTAGASGFASDPVGTDRPTDQPGQGDWSEAEQQLAAWLGPSGPEVVGMLRSLDGWGTQAAKGITAAYQRGPPRERLLKRVEEAELPAVVADGLRRAASDSPSWRSSFADSCIATTAAKWKDGERANGTTAPLPLSREERDDLERIRSELEEGGMDDEAAAKEAYQRIRPEEAPWPSG